ncbi:hypothetical protein [Spirosoma sordidisoli]|uniref:Plasmid replication protein RepL domain-containing protein n=1 Tax=Spirosoma sordidisoli TaxID=2502893 RepID=A0A4Q2UPQ7_9BACT|nr:hypothetical protein [Spirosoma sordidisoli]RYC69605.1 hypothetical protein EQG79_13460 [Spirosoma sordidisoli]
MKKQSVGITDFSTYDQNPYSPSGMESKRFIRQKDERVFINQETGEVVTMRVADESVTRITDPKAFIKLFQESLTSVGDLTVPGLKVLVYMMMKLKPGGDEVTIVVDSFLDHFDYGISENGQRSKMPYYKGIADLLSHKLIARKRGYDHTYFINVDAFFNGDRTKLVKQ